MNKDLLAGIIQNFEDKGGIVLSEPPKKPSYQEMNSRKVRCPLNPNCTTVDNCDLNSCQKRTVVKAKTEDR